MSYAEQIRHPGGALDPRRDSEPRSVFSLIPVSWWIIGAAIVALVLIGKYRPQWLEKIGVHVVRGGGPGGAFGPSFPAWRPG